jgi:hypothetical protein
LKPDRDRSYWKILFVGEDEKESIAQLVLIQHALEFLSSLDDTIAIVGVDDEDDALGVLEVVPPQGSDLVLPTNVPNSELDVLVLDSLDVESWEMIRRCRYIVSRCLFTDRGNSSAVDIDISLLSDPAKSRDTYTISPSLSLYRMVVFPAASRPTIKILISFFPHSLSNNFENVRPMIPIQLIKVRRAVWERAR